MAVNIPNQNNLNDVIKASTSLLKDVRKTIADHKKMLQKEKQIDLGKELQHIKTDLQSVIDFVKEMRDISKNIDVIVNNLLIILGMPASINERISRIKVETIDSRKLQAAIIELKRVLNTPAEINEFLNEGSEPLRLKTIRNAVNQIVFICRMPEYINKQIKGINVDALDKKTIAKIKDSLNLIFGKNGLVDSIEKTATRMDKFKGFGIRKSVALWNSIFYLNAISGQVVRFGRYSNRHAAELKLAIVGSTLILKFINEFAKTLQAINDISFADYIVLPIKIRFMRRIVRGMTRLVSNLVDLVWYLPEIALAILTLMALNKATEKLTQVVRTINQFKLTELLLLELKVPVLVRVTRSISNRLIPAMTSFGRRIVSLLMALVGLVILDKVIGRYNKVIEVIANTKMATLIVNLLKIRLLSMNARLIRNLIVHIGTLGRSAIKSAIAIPGLVVAYAIVALYSNIIATIRATKIGLFFRIKVRQLILGARLVRVLVRVISNLIGTKQAAKAFISVKLVNAIIKSFASIILNILLLTPIMAMFILLSPIIIVVFWLFARIFKIIVHILAKLINPKVVLVIVAVTSVIMMLCILGLSLVALALISIVIVENSLNILLFFGVVVAVSLMLALMGILLSKISPLLMSAIYGIGIVALAVFAVLAIAAMLWLLAKIDLDQEKIKENVKKVMSTVLFIVTSLFEDELNDPKSKDNAFTKILKVLGGAVAKIVMAIATCAILVATFVSVACILMIAVMLRMLQNLKLDQGRILQNVDSVFDTVEKIISRFMADDRGGKKSNRGILIGLMSWACPPMAKIVEALLSVAYLFLMFFAVSIVLGIASILRLLQNLNLDTTKIQANVDTVFNTVDQIINRIFGDRKDEEHKSNRGILIRIISWVDEGLAKIIEAALSVVYLMLVFQAIGLTLAIAGMLRLLQTIDLNFDDINKNVTTIFDTVDHIINRIFGPRDDAQYPSTRGILVSIISWVDPGLAKIVEAALSIVYLMLVMTSITIVLGIAGLLRAIQAIDLNFDDINSKITTIFDCVDAIISKVFAPAPDNAKASRGIFGRIIGFFNPGLANIIDAIMAIARLGLILVAVSIVVGIAKALESIQNIEFNGSEVLTKVDSIFETAGKIMAQVFEKADTMFPEPKNRGIFGSIISFFSPGLADILDALTMIARLAIIQTAISAVAGIGGSLKQIQDIDVNLTSAGEKVDQIMAVAENICERIFSRESKIKFPVPPEERKSVFGALISWAFGGKSDEDRALEAAMKKVEALGIIEAAVGALGNILEGAKRIVDMDIQDITNATTKVDEVMDMAGKLAETIFGANVKLTLPEPSNDDVQAALVELGFDHWWRSSNAGEIANAKAQASMKLAMQRVEVLGLIASAVGSIASIIDGIDKIRNYKSPNIGTIRTQVQQVIQSASDVATSIFNQTGGVAIDEIKRRIDIIKSQLEYTKMSITGVQDMSEGFAEFVKKSTFVEADVINTRSKVSLAVEAIKSIMSQIDEIKPDNGGKTIRTNCELMDRISTTVGSFVKVESDDVKNAKDITENYIKFFKQVDSMDIKKLQHTDWLMRSWASISRDLKGDFEGLAKTVNQHIMPMLEKVNETLEKTTKAQEEIIRVMSQPVDLNAGNQTTNFDNPGGQTPPGGGNPGGDLGNGNPGGGNTQLGGNTGATGYQPDTTARRPNTKDGKTKAPGRAGAGIDPKDMKPGKKYVVTIADKVTEA